MQNKADIRNRLQQDILSLQGFRPASANAQTNFGLPRIARFFPNATFPFSALHEFSCITPEEVTSAGAFVAGLLSPLFDKGGVGLWISAERLIFPPALKAFGINPDQIIFIELKKEKEVMWAVEEALKCDALTTVIGEMADISFTESRRFQLAIEQSGVGCFLLRNKPRNVTTASTSRWQIKPLPSQIESNLPGIGYPRWQVNLLKVRNGKPGSWVLEWAEGRFRHASTLAVIRGEEMQTKSA